MAITDHSCGQTLVVSAGDKRVLISSVNSGELLQVVTRDSGSIPYLLYHMCELFVASGNGSVRSYSIPHDLKRITPVSLLLFVGIKVANVLEVFVFAMCVCKLLQGIAYQ